MKAQGKCTTDHISAAGPWLKYRGHLENISGNLFLGVVNAFTGATGEGKDRVDGETRSFPDIAKHYSAEGVRWCAIGDRNYGEGSSREHAAMEPRFRGGVVIFARSFARIHETNLKKQGLVPLTFSDPATYDEIGEDDSISVLGLPAGARAPRPLPDRPPRRHARSTSRRRTPSARSRSSGSRRAAPSTSSAAGRLGGAQPRLGNAFSPFPVAVPARCRDRPCSREGTRPPAPRRSGCACAGPAPAAAPRSPS